MSVGSVALAAVLWAALAGVASGQKTFADTCACPTSIPCPNNCEVGECDAYDGECITGKTGERCNGESNSWCPNINRGDNCPSGGGGYNSGTPTPSAAPTYPCPAGFECPDGYTYDGRSNGYECCGCPNGYTRVMQQGAVWRCGGQLMYHCYRRCLGITTGICNTCRDGYYPLGQEAGHTETSAESCVTCPVGEYCVGGRRMGNCPEGFYCPAQTSDYESNLCDAGPPTDQPLDRLHGV